jgi:hypothetical protein
MSEKEGILRMQPSRRWTICRPDREPVEITSGELFRVEVDGVLRLTRMSHTPISGYFSIDDYELRDGMRAEIIFGGE